MALEKVGLAGVLKFDSDSAVQAIKRPRDEMGRFIQTEKSAQTQTRELTGVLGLLEVAFDKLSSGVKKSGDFLSATSDKIGGALRSAGLAALPITAALGVGSATAANFEQQMSAVAAVTSASDKEMEQLTDTAKVFGMKTVFSATQAAEGLELLGRGGFDAQQSIAGLAGVMNAAAADSIPLATSADIIANTINGMKLKAEDATDVADVLALTSARTNSDMIGLGEGMAYASAQASTMGIKLPVVAASLGVLADAGLKGSMAGTSFTNMLVHLSKPTEKGAKYMAQLGGAIFETKDGSLDLRRTMASLGPGLEKITSKTERAAKITEIFGIQGKKAVNALDTAITSGKFDQLVGDLEKEMDGAAGAAERMANVRIDNFKGAIEQLGGAIDGLSIEVFTPFLKNARSGLEGVTEGITGVVRVLMLLNNTTETSRDEMERQYGPRTVAVAYGIKDAVETLIASWNNLRSNVSAFFGDVLGNRSSEFIQTATKWAVMILMVAGAVAPVLIALSGLFYVLSGIGTMISGIGTLIGFVFSATFIPVIVAVIGAFLLLRNEGESVGDTISRMFQLVQTAILYVVDRAIMPFASAFTEQVAPAVMQVWGTISKFIASAKAEFQSLFSGIIQVATRLAPLFQGIFSVIGSIVGLFVKSAVQAFDAMLVVIQALFRPLRQIASFIMDVIVNGLITWVGWAVNLAEAVGITLPPGFKEFAQGGEFKIKEELTIDQAAGIDATKAAQSASNAMIDQKGETSKTPELNANVTIEDKRTVEVSNKVTLDGREQAVAQARHTQEVHERAGFKAAPWQRRIYMEQGAAPVGAR